MNGATTTRSLTPQHGELKAAHEPDRVHAYDEYETLASPSPHTTDEDLKMRPRQMTIELPGSDESIEILYDKTLSVEDHSPKPCIIPGNALHLIDDDPASPRSPTPSSVIIVENELAHDCAHDATREHERSTSEPPPPARPGPRVRFRSRVRITSGVHRHKHRHRENGGMRGDNVENGHANGHGPVPSGTVTPSSGTDSPSSSISAPLRLHADENAAWGPLGRRISAYGAAARQKRLQASPRAAGMARDGPWVGAHAEDVEWGADEHTPLVRPPRRMRVRPEHEDDDELFEDELRAAALRREEEELFGPWPRRLLNRHWWWWHLEPVVCCTYCSEDSDYEE